MAELARSSRARFWVVLVAALSGALVTARLGVWQLDRASQKVALQAAIDSRASLPPLAAGDLAADAAGAEAQHFRRIHLQGRWVRDATVYLDNRQMHGRTGFFVVTPLALADGTAVLVQRGWVPRNFEVRQQLVPVATPGDTVELEGRVAPPPSKLFEFDSAASGVIRQNLDLDAFSRETRLRLRPLSLQQLGDGSAEGLQRDWLQPALDVQKHYGYAFQWFAMATLITGLYVWFQIVRPRRRPAPR